MGIIQRCLVLYKKEDGQIMGTTSSYLKYFLNCALYGELTLKTAAGQSLPDECLGLEDFWRRKISSCLQWALNPTLNVLGKLGILQTHINLQLSWCCLIKHKQLLGCCLDHYALKIITNIKGPTENIPPPWHMQVYFWWFGYIMKEHARQGNILVVQTHDFMSKQKPQEC